MSQGPQPPAVNSGVIYYHYVENVLILVLFNLTFSLEPFIPSPAIGPKLVTNGGAGQFNLLTWIVEGERNPTILKIVVIRLADVLEKNTLSIFKKS